MLEDRNRLSPSLTCTKPELLYLTSDLHFGHGNIIRYCNRPFSSLEEMDEGIIKKWNNKIPQEATTIFLGDFSFHHKLDRVNHILSRLNGKKVIVKGNHDGDAVMDANWDMKFVAGPVELVVGKQRAFLLHYPLESWEASYHGTYHLHGHMHGTTPFNPNRRKMDVGIDAHPNFEPFSWAEVDAKLSKVPVPKDVSPKNKAT